MQIWLRWTDSRLSGHLGMVSDFTPKFVKQFAKVGDVMKEAFAAYIEETKQGSFPAPEHTFKISEDVINKLY